MLGCSASAGEDDADVAGSETGEVEPRKPPAFIEPVNDVLTLQTTRAADVSLLVDRIVPGLTALVIDDISYGPLETPRPIGVLTPEELLLFIRGGLVEGRHIMWLQTPNGEELLRSSDVQVDIVPAEAFSMDASSSSQAALQADRISSWGQGREGVLIGVRDGEPATATIVRGTADGWNVDDTVELPLPELAATSADRAPPMSAAVVVGEPDDASDDRLRVAWSTADGRVLLVDEPWGEGGHNPRVIVELDELVQGPIEHASLGRPALLGDLVVVEVFQTRDIEAPKPGDHALALVALSGAPAEPGPVRWSSVAGTADADLLGRAIDLTAVEVEGRRLLSARLGGATAGLIEVDRESGTLTLSRGSGEALQQGVAGWQDAISALVTVRGAFGSRVVFGFHAPEGEPAVRIQRINDWGSGQPTSSSIGASNFPAVPSPRATASPAVGLLSGAPLILLPMGPDEAVIAVLSIGTAPTLRSLEPLHCDEVAVAATEGGNEDGPLQVACLREGEVFFATVNVAE